MPTIPDVKHLASESNEDGSSTPVVPPEVPPIVPPVTPPPAKPGEKTDPALLLESLKDEREKRRVVEATLKELQDAIASGDTLSAEGKVLADQVSELKGQIASMGQEKVMTDLQTQYPALKDKADEFKTYLADPENAGMNVKTAARAFLTDNGLLDNPPPRKGMETPVGGGRNTTPQGYTFAAIEKLRQENFRNYTKLLKAGAFNDVNE